MVIRYPRLRPSVRMTKLPSGVHIVEQYTDKSGLYGVKVGYALALCSGGVGTDVIARCLAASFGDTDSEAFADRVLYECGQFVEVFDSPVEGDFRYDFADFVYSPKTPGLRYDSPVSAQLILTNRCNFSCEYCFNSSGPEREREMSTENWLSLIRQMRDMGVTKVDLTGGEPMILRDFGLILNACAEAGMLITVFTNGSFITSEWAERFAQIENLIVQVSIDSPYEEVHDRVTATKGQFERVKNAVRLLNKAGAYVRCKALIMPDTLGGARDLIRLCEKLGAKSLTLDTYDLCRVGRGDNRFFMPPDDSLRVREIVAEELARLNGAMGLRYSEGRRRWRDESEIVSCGAMREGFSVMAGGDFTLCEKTSGDPNCLIGRFPEMSLAQIWTSPRIDEITRPDSDAYQQPCRDCEHISRCRGGCPAAVRLVSDVPHAADPRCWKAEYPQNPFATAKG